MNSANVRANLGSTTAANAITSNIGVTGTLGPGNGGTGVTSLAALLKALSLEMEYITYQ